MRAIIQSIRLNFVRTAFRSQTAFFLPTTTRGRTVAPAFMLTNSMTSIAGSSQTDGKTLPDQARVVVVGGGVIGCSTLYHLAKMGWKDVILLERDKLTSGTTWHAAGLMVTFGSLSETSTDLRKYTKHLYDTLEEETGLATGFMPVGFIELATSPDHLEEYRRISAFNRKCGIDVHEISPVEVQTLFPLCKIDDVLAGFYVPDDGRVNPVDVSMSLARGAKNKGARIFEDTTVTDVLQENGKVTGVQVGEHTIKAEYVVNACGMWARQFGEMAGVNVPNQAAEHYYLLTDAMPDVDLSWPVIEDPSSHTYIRPEGAGLMVGLFEPKGASWNVGRIPSDFSFGEIEPDWERMAPFVDTAMNRVPRTLEAGVKKFFCGPESFTPDLAPILGEAPELKNYFVAAGMNSIGILTGGGVGRLMASWIINGLPDADVTGMNIDRFQRYQSNPQYRASRVVESLGNVYKCHYPFKTLETARGIKHSPVHARHVANRACFRDVSGWEMADWYAPANMEPTNNPLGWGKPAWFEQWGVEHQTCREGVVIMDMSFMSKFLVEGRDAGAFLNWLSTANVDGYCDKITYTQWLNMRGKVEADLTITKMAPNRFMVVASDNMHGHVLNWMRQHVSPEDHVVIADVTGAEAQLNVQGPKSRELLQKLTTQNLSDEAFPFRTCSEIDIGFARGRCARITYLGELGYELFVPTECALHVYDQIAAAGDEFGLIPAGLKALASLRLEKSYRDYGHDVDNTDTLLEVGLGFTADFEKPGGFQGKEMVQNQKALGVAGLTQRLVQILIQDPEPMMYHGEVVYRDGRCVGDVRAASYGHTLGGSVGLALVQSHYSEIINAAFIKSGNWEVDIAGKMYPASVCLRPMYDPKNLRIKS